jgi:hypothetical protein
MLVHLDRLTNQLQADQLGRDRAQAADPPWLRAVRTARPRLTRPARRDQESLTL